MLSGKQKWQRPGKPTETGLVLSLLHDTTAESTSIVKLLLL